MICSTALVWEITHRSHSADPINEGTFGVMVAALGDLAVPVPLVGVAGYKKLVPPDLPV